MATHGASAVGNASKLAEGVKKLVGEGNKQITQKKNNKTNEAVNNEKMAKNAANFIKQGIEKSGGKTVTAKAGEGNVADYVKNLKNAKPQEVGKNNVDVVG